MWTHVLLFLVKNEQYVVKIIVPTNIICVYKVSGTENILYIFILEEVPKIPSMVNTLKMCYLIEYDKFCRSWLFPQIPAHLASAESRDEETSSPTRLQLFKYFRIPIVITTNRSVENRILLHVWKLSIVLRQQRKCYC